MLLVLAQRPGAGMLGQIGEEAHDAGLQLPAEGIVDGAQLQVDQRIVEVGNAAAVERIAEAIPGLLRRWSAARANRERRGTGRRADRG